MSRSPPHRRAKECARPGRRFFLAIGVGRPAGMLPDLPAVGADLARMNRLFANLGYTLVSLPLDLTATRLRAALAEWLAQASLNAADSVVIYYSGHGALARGGDHYLCTVGFDAAQPAVTGFKTQYLAELFLAGRPQPGRFWLILDCCQAGSVFRDANFHGLSGEQTDAFILAASSGWGQAVDGAFSESFRDAVRHARALTRGGAVSLDQLVGAVNQRWRGGRAIQSAVSARPFDLLQPSLSPPPGAVAPPRRRILHPASAAPRRRALSARRERSRSPSPAVISSSLAKS